MHADLPMHTARVQIATRLLKEGMALSFQVDAPGVDVRGGATSCRRLTARRVRCRWEITAYVCADDEFEACDTHPAARTSGEAWATKRDHRIRVTLGSDARRRGAGRSVFPDGGSSAA